MALHQAGTIIPYYAKPNRVDATAHETVPEVVADRALTC
jgi:hypothetical protein